MAMQTGTGHAAAVAAVVSLSVLVCVLMPVQLALPSTESNKTMPGTQGTVYCWLLPSARMRAILIELN